MNTLIIKKVLVHMIDFEHRKIHLSDDFATINDTTQDYYRKKMEKAFNSNQLKELTVPSLHEMLLRADQMFESDDNFKAQAKEITEKFFALGSVIEAMPNCDMLYVEAYCDGDHVMAALKLNYKRVPVSVVDGGNVRITVAQTLPGQGAPVDEAIIVNGDRRTVSLIEKKYSIDGKMQTYLNEKWIKGEEKLTDREKLSAMKRVVRKAEKNYLPFANKAMPMLKQELKNKVEHQEVIKPVEIVENVLKDDYQTSTESTDKLKDLGVGQDDTLNGMALSASLDRCKIETDNHIVIQMDVDTYVAGTAFTIVDQPDGKTSITIKDIESYTVK